MDYALTLYFDGRCSLCISEMERLRRWDKAGKLEFVDIAQDGFEPASLGVDMAALNALLHSRTRDGRVLVGIDSIVAAYTLTGRGWLVGPLRFAPTRRLWSWLYRGIARNRYRLSALFGYRASSSCDSGVCSRDREPFF
ncbi:thiol-disulfide oxidoreductase DCC family protein [Herbaspirillum sp. NPDC087042]|uniref:thiol-disulfide oxidoreductase DCC family protein n=1 Tax=Herbaspirillum sp. NPDC087042 TaxID=3364004 RepID=UPI003804574F